MALPVAAKAAQSQEEDPYPGFSLSPSLQSAVSISHWPNPDEGNW